MLSKPYILSSLKILLTLYHKNDEYFFKLHMKPIFQDHYMKHFILFLSRPFSSPIVWLHSVVQLLCQVTHKDIYFKTIL